MVYTSQAVHTSTKHADGTPSIVYMSQASAREDEHTQTVSILTALR